MKHIMSQSSALQPLTHILYTPYVSECLFNVHLFFHPSHIVDNLENTFPDVNSCTQQQQDIQHPSQLHQSVPGWQSDIPQHQDVRESDTNIQEKGWRLNRWEPPLPPPPPDVWRFDPTHSSPCCL